MADYFTKPLQGMLFRKFRDLIMNTDSSKTMRSELNACLKNRRSVLESDESARLPDDGTRLTNCQKWTDVGHAKRTTQRNRILNKKILEKRTRSV